MTGTVTLTTLVSFNGAQPTTLVSFNGTNGELPRGSLIADSNGDLFGTTELGGANGVGTVFEIVKTAGGYASTPDHTGQLQRRRRSRPRRRSDRRRQRRPVRHDAMAARTATARCSRSSRLPAATPARPPRWSASTGRHGATLLRQPDRRFQRRPFRHDRRAARTTTARCSRSPRLPAATPARPPRWSASTERTARRPSAV